MVEQVPALICAFALGRGMYCGRAHRHEGQHAPERAPVNGTPRGTISWAEHEEAWAEYHRHHPGQDALRIASRGGFGLWELCDQLGHAPQTWEPSRDTSAEITAAMRYLASCPASKVIDLARDIEKSRVGREPRLRSEKEAADD